MGEFDEAAARAALRRHISRGLLHDRALADRLAFQELTAPGAFHLVFESFTEKRQVRLEDRPYRGGAVDGPGNGPAPDVWDVPAAPPQVFGPRAEVERPIPHTSAVVTCSRCSGNGKVSCHSCSGSGTVTSTRMVTDTDSDGKTSTRFETESETCHHCGGSGRVTCHHCDGTGQLETFQLAVIEWETHRHDKVLEYTDLPDELIPKAGGEIVLTEERERMDERPTEAAAFGGPVRVNANVNAAANGLVRHHGQPEPGARVLRQRLAVRAVPVYQVTYRWGQTVRRFWIYGAEQRVRAPRLPVSPLRALAVAVCVAVVAAVVGLVIHLR